MEIDSNEELRNEVHKIKLEVGKIKDLDIVTFGKLEKMLNRKLTDGEKAYIRYLLDQSEKSRDMMTHRMQYSDDTLDEWK